MEKTLCERSLFRKFCKGNVMKNIVYLLFLISFSSMAASLRLTPLEQNKISNGDLLEVKVFSDVELNWQLLKMQKIGEIFYILDVYPQNKMMSFAKVMVMPPLKNENIEKFKINNVEFKVEVVGFETNLTKDQPIQDYIVLDTDYMEKLSYDWKIYLILIIFFGMIITFRNKFKNMWISRKNKKRFQEKQKDLLNLLESAKDRKDYEYIYQIKNELTQNFIIDKKSFDEFKMSMNSIQYLPEWNEENLNLAKLSLSKLKNELREKSGI